MTTQGNRVEMVVQKRITRAYLSYSPIKIVLQRPTYVDSLAGGKIAGPPTQVTEQTFRIIPFKRRLTVSEAITQEGQLTKNTFALMGEQGADVKPGDYFVLSNCRYEVDSVEPSSPEFSFRSLAVLSYYGVPDNGD